MDSNMSARNNGEQLQCYTTETLPVRDIRGQDITSVSVLSSNDTLVSYFTVDSILLPLNSNAELHNRQMREKYGYGASILSIVNDKSFSFNTDLIYLSKTKLGSRPVLLNLILNNPGHLFSMTGLAQIAPSMREAVSEYTVRFGNKRPLLQKINDRKQIYVGLAQGIILLDQREAHSG